MSAVHVAATAAEAAPGTLLAAVCLALAVGGLLAASLASALVRSSVRTHAGQTRQCLNEARLDGDLPWGSPEIQDLVDWFDVVSRSGRMTSSGRHGIGRRDDAAPDLAVLADIASRRGLELLQEAATRRAWLASRGCAPLTLPWWNALLRNRLPGTKLALPLPPAGRHPARIARKATPPPPQPLIPVAPALPTGRLRPAGIAGPAIAASALAASAVTGAPPAPPTARPYSHEACAALPTTTPVINLTDTRDRITELPGPAPSPALHPSGHPEEQP